MNIAIILSGGKGERIKSDVPKQYIDVGGRNVLSFCTETVFKCDKIDAVVIVCEAEYAGEVFETVDKFGNAEKLIGNGIVFPGVNRQGSIISALNFIIGNAKVTSKDRVIIFDAARPFTTEKMIRDLLFAAEGHDGAMPIIPMKDTVYLCDNAGRIEGLVDRDKVYAGQAPEVFNFVKYKIANDALTSRDILKVHGSSEVAVKAGMDIVTIKGDEKNFKITTDEDLDKLMSIVKNRG